MPKVKTVFAGDSGVGKTCIIEYAAKNTFREHQYATVGAANVSVPIECELDGKKQTVTFNIWDTAGQEKYRSLAPMYFAGAHLAVLVFDLTQSSTFTDLDSFFRLLQDKAPEDCIYVLAGNKVDLVDQREVEREEADNYRLKIGADFYFETSALNGTGIKEMFLTAATCKGISFEMEETDYLADDSGTVDQQFQNGNCNC
jgi:small GTP-binding protein